MDWQPIETAPKDRSTKFIGLLETGRAVTAVPHYRCKYEKQEGGGFKCVDIVFDGWQEDRGDALIPCQFTHWMPLLAPPTGA